MRQKDVIIGRYYLAKVSEKVVIVRIEQVSSYGGWDALNTETQRMVRIKTAGRLRAEVRN